MVGRSLVCERCANWAVTVIEGERLCSFCAAIARGDRQPGSRTRPSKGRNVTANRHTEPGRPRERVGANPAVRSGAPLKTGRPCPECGRALYRRDTLGGGWFRCVLCHRDVRPSDGAVRDEVLALVLLGFAIDRSTPRNRA